MPEMSINKKLEQLIKSNLTADRMQAAEEGYGLERLVHDVDPYIRKEVALQGYGLDMLSKDADPMVWRQVHGYLRANGISLKDWVQNNPEKCVLPQIKEQIERSGLQIKNISILTDNEYVEHRSVIPKCDRPWWIRKSDGGSVPLSDKYAYTVNEKTGFFNPGDPKRSEKIRPVLRVECDESCGLAKKDKVDLLGQTWTVLDVTGREGLLICDKLLQFASFDGISSEWETSSIKGWLENWLESKLDRGSVKQSLSDKIFSAEARLEKTSVKPEQATELAR